MNARRLTFICALLCYTLSYAQVGCEYRLELYDTFGDGWNGGSVIVVINEKAENYLFTDGFTLSVSLLASEGDLLELTFVSGAFDSEASLRLYDPLGEEVYDSGLHPAEGLLYSTTTACPDCPNLPLNGLNFERVRHDRATVRWVMNDPEGRYQLSYGPAGILPEEATVISVKAGDEYVLTGLEQHSRYEVYLQAICSNGDTSNQIGPFSFQTLWTRDVGVEALISPVSDCGMPSAGVISLRLKNYGGAPQTLIPYNYSVNGIPGAVDQPNDGLFTGILSFDSTFAVSFDARFDFSNPQSYLVKVWTELEGDSDPANDTIASMVVHTPLITQFPYSIDFESGPGGWMLHPDSQSPSLELGKPEGNALTGANSGQNAWVTNLDGSYNNRERSMLLSPCLDFSALDKDPELSFYLWISTESTFDGAWVETAVAGGAWTKLGVSGGAGSFWYNFNDDKYGHWWSGDNIFGGWRKVRYPLNGLAGASDVRLRIVFVSDEAVVREGIGIDDVFIAPALDHNLVAGAVAYLGDSECGDAETSVEFTFRNEGAVTQKNYTLAYQINNHPVVRESVNIEVAPETAATYTFATPFDAGSPAEYLIRAWTELPDEAYPVNDTASLIYSTAGPGIPYLENFEGRKIPADWTVDQDGAVENGHNSGSYVLFDNMWKDDTVFQAVTPLLGPLQAGDTLFFSYRFVNFMGSGTQPTILGPLDALRVEVSEDCGNSFHEALLINAQNHKVKNTLQTFSLPLDAYAGRWIKLRFRASWGAGDYYIDLDNVNIRRCPASLGLQATVTQPTAGNNGSIRVETAAGIAPYFYYWSNGVRQSSATGLAPGSYQITVSDQQGCTDQINVVLQPVVASREPLSMISSVRLAPNPNNGHSLLELELDRPADVRITIFDARGSVIRQEKLQHLSQIRYAVDLSGFPNGVYFIRMLVRDELKTLRMIKANVP